MGSSGCQTIRIDLRLALSGLLVMLGGCAMQPPVRTYEAGVELPDGPGRAILVNQCLVCHELESLELFKDFYNRELWRTLVVSMRANGAEVSDGEVEVLSDYLGRHFGVE
jgi:hypothetical protein